MLITLSFIFGAIVGSFLNVVILRLPEEETLGGRSHCTSCGHTLSAWQLIPIVSFLFLGGKCAFCRAKISPRYIIIEVLCGLLFAGSVWYLNPQTISAIFTLLVWWTAAASLLSIFVIDLEHYLIFDVVVFIASAVVIVCKTVSAIAAGSSVLAVLTVIGLSLLGAVVGALPFFLIWWFSKGKWMGFGDVKLMLLLGVLAGPTLVFITLLLAIFSGGIISLFLLIFTKKTMKSHIPFGCFLAPAGLIVLVFGQQILNWYLGILGF